MARNGLLCADVPLINYSIKPLFHFSPLIPFPNVNLAIWLLYVNKVTYLPTYLLTKEVNKKLSYRGQRDKNTRTQ